ncbi:chitosanase [Kitasatospora viridis]|uniref:Chitosanase n=1 Tax=Kitasatospora viridis TaxID=281105 RepID=A0A561T730_9ACTN|nr:chitosanase [Kitasatospora viridis]TWF82902.1 chitosanase [Kitasatospora viridis]
MTRSATPPAPLLRALALLAAPVTALSLAGAATAHAAAAPAGVTLTSAQQYAVDEITNVFENGDLTSGFAAIKDYGDGCGYTAGYIGFCTQTDDDVKLVTAYDTARPGNPLAKYLPALRKLAAAGSDAHTGLDGFPNAWKAAAKDQAFIQAQFDQAHANYLAPALAEARKVGIATPLGVADFFDTAVEMGPDGAPDSPDGLLVLVAETTKAESGTPATGVAEATWLTKFNQVRTAHLKNPKTPGRKSDWPQSVDRVQALQQMATAGKWSLPLPLLVGADFQVTIPKAPANGPF